MTSSSSVEIASSDVVKLIQQFLKENNLIKTFESLKEESGLNINTCDSYEQLESDISNGRWEKVIPVVKNLKLSQKILTELYEQIIIEMIELKEQSCSYWLFSQSLFQQYMLKHKPEKLKAMEIMLSTNNFDAKEAYPAGTSKDKVRHHLSSEIMKQVSNVAPSRLLTLLGQSLKWQQSQGLLPPGQHIDIFYGKTAIRQVEPDMYVNQLLLAMEFEQSSHPETAIFTPDGQYLITGSVDGFIEIWNYSTGKIRKDLHYQASENWLVMDSTILSMKSSDDSKLLATGSQSGKISIWDLVSGKCIHKIENAHSNGVTSLEFYRENTQLFSSGFDSIIRLHSIKNKKILKEYKGHMSFVNDICHPKDSNLLLSGSSDGSVKIWNIKTTECLHTFRPMESVSILSVSMNPINNKEFLICLKSNTAIMMNFEGQIKKHFSNGKTQNSDFVKSSYSVRGKYVYCLSEDNHLYCFDAENQRLERTLPVHAKDPLGLVHHPYHNILVTYGEDNKLNLWRP